MERVVFFGNLFRKLFSKANGMSAEEFLLEHITTCLMRLQIWGSSFTTTTVSPQGMVAGAEHFLMREVYRCVRYEGDQDSNGDQLLVTWKFPTTGARQQLVSGVERIQKDKDNLYLLNCHILEILYFFHMSSSYIREEPCPNCTHLGLENGHRIRRTCDSTFDVEWCTGQEETPSLMFLTQLRQRLQIPELSDWSPPKRQ